MLPRAHATPRKNRMAAITALLCSRGVIVSFLPCAQIIEQAPDGPGEHQGAEKEKGGAHGLAFCVSRAETARTGAAPRQ